MTWSLRDLEDFRLRGSFVIGIWNVESLIGIFRILYV